MFHGTRGHFRRLHEVLFDKKRIKIFILIVIFLILLSVTIVIILHITKKPIEPCPLNDD